MNLVSSAMSLKSIKIYIYIYVCICMHIYMASVFLKLGRVHTDTCFLFLHNYTSFHLCCSYLKFVFQIQHAGAFILFEMLLD